MEQLQDSRGGGSVRGEDIRQLLSKQFAMAYSLNGVYDLLKRLDMAWISAAPSAMANMMPARSLRGRVFLRQRLSHSERFGVCRGEVMALKIACGGVRRVESSVISQA